MQTRQKEAKSVTGTRALKTQVKEESEGRDRIGLGGCNVQNHDETVPEKQQIPQKQGNHKKLYTDSDQRKHKR